MYYRSSLSTIPSLPIHRTILLSWQRYIKDGSQIYKTFPPTSLQGILAELKSVFQCSEPVETCEPEGVVPFSQEEDKLNIPECVGHKRKRKDKSGETVVPVKKIIGDGTRDPHQPYCWSSQATGITIRQIQNMANFS